MDISHLARMGIDGDTAPVHQIPRGDKHLVRVEQVMRDAPLHQHPVAGRHQQIRVRLSIPQSTGAKSDGAQLRHREQSRPAHPAATDPAHRLQAVVFRLDVIALAQLFDPARAVGGADHRAGGKADDAAAVLRRPIRRGGVQRMRDDPQIGIARRQRVKEHQQRLAALPDLDHCHQIGLRAVGHGKAVVHQRGVAVTGERPVRRRGAVQGGPDQTMHHPRSPSAQIPCLVRLIQPQHVIRPVNAN